MILTRDQAIAEHKEMWLWIAEEIEKLKLCVNIGSCKIKYLSKKKYKVYPWGNCFLCQYDFQFSESVACERCPVKSTGEGNGCLGGLFFEVCHAETWQKQAALARQIAELPERENV